MENAHPPDALLAEADLRPEVERHLEACPRCRVHRRLLRLTDTDPPDSEGAAASETAAEDVGTLLDEDGSGNRWLVWDESLGRLVMHVEPLDGGDPSWFADSIAILRRLAHPHVARVHAVLRSQPLRYLRDRVPGVHLGQLDVEADPRAAAWLAQAASGLAALHHAGVCHGRLKPTSIRVTPEGQVQIVDVGLVEAHDEREDWKALCGLFEALPGPIGARVRELSEALDRGEADGTELLAWLLALRDPGAGGGPRYESRGLLGMGGMGEVRSVYDPLLDRVVAQKVLSAALVADGEQISRFLDEAHITAQLQHPGVVPVHDLEHLSNGAVAFTMKQLDGRTMAQVVRDLHATSTRRWASTDDGWTLRRLVEALRRVCDAVAYAHDRGVVHLDLKPGNVMLGEYGEVLVFDWGLAQRLHGGVARLPRPAGTPGYMPPEQCRPAGDEGVVVGPAADIFAVGVMLREVLDGESPEEGLDGQGWVPGRSDAPRELVSIARRATQADPAERYATVQDVARDLAAWQDHRPVSAHGYAVWERVWRRIRPHQAPIAVSVVAVVVLLALSFVSWVQVEGQRVKADGMLAQSLVDKANLAWDARDPIQAEAFASAAVGLAGRSDARGLLARLAQGWRPSLARRWPDVCEELAAIDGAVACATGKEVRGWNVGAEASTGAWVVPGRLSELHRGADGMLMATAERAVVRIEASNGDARQSVIANASQPLTGAASLAGGDVVRAFGPTVERLAREKDGRHEVVSSVSLESGVRALTPCGAERVAVATDAGRLFLVRPDLPVDEGALVSIEADRITGAVACDARGRMLAIVSGRDVQLWAVDPPVQRHILIGHLGEVEALDFSPDRQTLATASRDGTVRLWNVRRGEEIGRLPGHSGVSDVAFTVDGTGLLTATDAGVRLWTLPERPSVGTFDVVVQVTGLHWAADGSLFTLDRLGRPAGFDPETGLQTLPVFLRVSDFDTAPTGERIAFGTDDGDFGVLDLDENVFTLRTPSTHPGGTTAVAWQPGAEVVASAGRAGAVIAWSTAVAGDSGDDRAKSPPIPSWSRGVGASIDGLAWSGDGTRLAARTVEGVVVLKGDTGDEVLRLPGAIQTHALGPSGEQMALAWSRGGLALGTLSRGRPTFDALGVDGQVVGLSFSTSEPLLAAVTREGLVQIFDTRDGRELGRHFAHPGGATAVAFSPDGRVLASSGSRGEVVLLDSRPLIADSGTLEAEIAARYGVSRHGTELEFR